VKKIIINYFLVLVCVAFSCVQLNAQCQNSIEIIELFCVTDSTYNLTVGIDTSISLEDSVEVSINDVVIDQYVIGDFPLTFIDIVQSVGMNDSISVCGLGDDLCCDVLGYVPPTNYCADCFNYWLDFEFSCDTDSTYEFILTPIVSFPDEISSEGNLYVDIDSRIYEFEYEVGRSYTISGVKLNENTVFHEILYFFVEVDCGVSVLLIASPDCEAICSVDSVMALDFVCTSDTTYSMLVNANLMVPEELAGFLPVQVRVNGEVHGIYSVSSIPLMVENIPITFDDISSVEICVLDLPEECCSVFDYSDPGCGTTSVNELNSDQEVLVYPNPVIDIMQLKNTEGELFVYASSGDLVIHEKQVVQQVDVRLLPSGVYYLVVLGESVKHCKFVKY
jgi:hypothetical protein